MRWLRCEPNTGAEDHSGLSWASKLGLRATSLPGPSPIVLLLLGSARQRKASTLTIHVEAEMRVTVKKWGNSASVRIPAAIMEAARLSLDDAVDVREEGGRIVIEPVRQKEYDLARLLADITPQNLHAEVDFGSPQGKEAL